MNSQKNKIAIIIGAGPAGLTAAFELLEKGPNIKPIIFEVDGQLGGIAKTINYKGNRMDMGGHRFFSKSDRVMGWWERILPTQGPPPKPNPDKTDLVMLIRSRISRILFLRRFFDYPVTLSKNTIVNLGPVRMTKIGFSYLKAWFFPIRPEKSLEDFFVNRFGRELYLTFFKDYTEKLWGVPCSDINPEWGAQRVKGLSILKALSHLVKQALSSKKTLAQKELETSLIGQFLYPKFGPGQMWEEVAKRVQAAGGEIHLNHQVVGLIREGDHIVSARVKNETTGEVTTVAGDYFISTMPVRELIDGLEPVVPNEVRQAASGLMYRDFITVGLLLKKMKVGRGKNGIVPDNWIYIQEPDVKLGRLQIFNNWSPYLVRDPNTIWLGLEYFCNEGDELWNKTDAEFMKFAIAELAKIGVIDASDVLDSTLARVKKAYPAYFGTYDRFEFIRKYVDQIENLFLIGRNGMHRYNNTDHSMLTAMTAVENIVNNIKTKESLWDVNAEQEYHEEKKRS